MVFFIFIFIGLSQSHDMIYGFDELIQVGSHFIFFLLLIIVFL
jgi:hypothetical protein